MSQIAYQIRPLRRCDFPGVVKIAKENALQNPITTLHSWMTYDPEGILVAVSETGTVLGMCSCVKNTDNLYFGGIFCVGKDYRHLEVGHQLFAKCFLHAKSENIGCNVSSDKVNSYKRRGMGVFESDWSTVEYEKLDKVDPLALSDDLPPDVDILSFHDGLFTPVSAYDRSVVNMDRTDILDFTFNEDDSLTLVAINGGGACVGYGCIKLGIQGAGRIGPLYADDPRVAETILRRLIIGFPKAKGVAFVSVSTNLHANKFMKKLGVPLYDNHLRVYSKTKLHCKINKIYAQFDIDFTPF